MTYTWHLLAKLCALPWVASLLIRVAMRTPHQHIYSKDGGTLYMGRWWMHKPSRWLPGVRIHHIRVHDQDRHMHSHPWNARTIILRGWYQEVREGSSRPVNRCEGNTAPLSYGEFHRITRVCPGGCWTLFITWRKQGEWYFDVDGQRVHWREYLGLED